MIDVVERPPKYNDAFRRPLKLMAVYNLRNQQAVTRAIPGYIRTARVCALYVLNPYLLAAKTLLFLAILGLSFSQVVATGAVGSETMRIVVGDGASAAFLIPRTLVPRPPSVHRVLRFLRSICAPPVALIKIPLPLLAKHESRLPNRDVAQDRSNESTEDSQRKSKGLLVSSDNSHGGSRNF